MEKINIVLAVSLIAIVISFASFGYTFYTLSDISRDLKTLTDRTNRFIDYMGREGFSEYSDYELELMENATENGESVMVYSSAGAESMEALTDAFNVRYPGIAASSYLAPTVQSAVKIIEEVDTGVHGADLFIGAVADILTNLTEGGYFEAYEPKAIEPYPNFTKIGAPYWYSCTPILKCGVYNTELVSSEEIPTTWQDILDPKWKGKIAVLDWTISQSWAWRLYKQFGVDYMTKLGQQELKVYPRTADVIMSVVAGETYIGLAQSPDRIKAQMDLGAPVLPLIINEVDTLDRVVAVIKNTPNPNAAKLFIEFLLSVKGQVVFNVDFLSPSYHPDAPELKIPGYTGEIELYAIDWIEFLENYKTDVAIYGPLLSP